MITKRHASERGHFDHGWLDTYHTFSFGAYHDPEQMGFRALRVINEDVVAPGQGFGTHPHRDMEIVTYVLSGALEHRDSMGSGSVIRPGDVQRMTAGTGITHSEFNASQSEAVHLLQIWVLPESPGLEPSYAEKHFPAEMRRNRLAPIVTGDGRDGSLTWHRDVHLYAALLDTGARIERELVGDRHAWLQIASGEVELNGVDLAAGDGAAVSDIDRIEIEAWSAAELLLFDLD
jgi:redox-sensitive bicupin YhaK (pirin superfamily)